MVVTNTRIETRPKLFISADLMKDVNSFKYSENYIDTLKKCNTHIKHLKKT